jgi:hypothetical protein
MLLRVGCISDRTLILIIMGVLICSFHLQTIGAEPLPQMQLETDKSVYELGENVTIILTNVANQTMIIGGYPAWQIYTYPDEVPVYPMFFATCIWQLEPGENDSLTWNQLNEFTGEPVDTGTYVVRDTKGWGLSTYFGIVVHIMPWDITGLVTWVPDGKCDIGDVALVALLFGSEEGDDRYDARADITGPEYLVKDGKIDIRDIALVALHFGEEYI